MSTLAEAQQARDALIREFELGVTPHATIVGIGIAREGGEYVVAVDVTDDGAYVPVDIEGTPVRCFRGRGRPVAYRDKP